MIFQTSNAGRVHPHPWLPRGDARRPFGLAALSAVLARL